MHVSSMSKSSSPQVYKSSEAAGEFTNDSKTDSETYLSWKERTSEINLCILSAFKAIAGNTQSQWGWFNGSDSYGISGIKEHKLMKKIVREAAFGNKDFYALDIGAGDYQWGRSLAEYLNKKKDIPEDVKIHIIGIRGETNLDRAVTELGQCMLYEFGQFQIEAIVDEFQRRGLQLTNKVDLAVSRWCFRHLVDPVGTFAQVYDLLRPKTGYLLLDGFYFLHENENMSDKSLYFNGRMIRLFLETGAPFLTRRHDDNRSLDHFILNKPDDRPCRIKKQYIGTAYPGYGWQIGSETVTRFKELKEKDAKITRVLYEGDYRGDKALYEQLRQQGLLNNSALVWGPLQENDANKNPPLLHTAIASSHEEAIYQCLREGCDINESDDKGSTPLHLAIKHNNYKLFSFLIKNGAKTKLFAGESTPLHLAILYDFNGCFIKDLIEKGAEVNLKPNKFYVSNATPLGLAIEHKNVKAVELLLVAKAIVSYKNRRSLDSDANFSFIQHLLPKRLRELEGFDTIIHHIQEGDSVILSYPNSTLGQEFQNSAQKKEERKIIRVIVNPETYLLDDENYEEIEDISHCKAKLVFEEDISKDPHLEFRFGY